MTSLYLVTLGGITFSGREAALVVVVVVVLALVAWFALSRARRA